MTVRAGPLPRTALGIYHAEKKQKKKQKKTKKNFFSPAPSLPPPNWPQPPVKIPAWLEKVLRIPGAGIILLLILFPLTLVRAAPRCAAPRCAVLPPAAGALPGRPALGCRRGARRRSAGEGPARPAPCPVIMQPAGGYPSTA